MSALCSQFGLALTDNNINTQFTLFRFLQISFTFIIPNLEGPFPFLKLSWNSSKKKKLLH